MAFVSSLMDNYTWTLLAMVKLVGKGNIQRTYQKSTKLSSNSRMTDVATSWSQPTLCLSLLAAWVGRIKGRLEDFLTWVRGNISLPAKMQIGYFGCWTKPKGL